ncbi:GreA/GreB family elongation factor [Hydrogenophaga sp. OTU3427]|uniref:GreA/GreB family elongation factor n=1 Tax=Hydrogenophaga sp. OTU3427 TaxID=3043856 RepID=UPI00313C56F9
MSNIPPGELWLTKLDHGRLFKLNGGHPPEPLADVLDTAEIIESAEVRPDVVTLYSQVLVTQDDGEQRKLTLCYPDDAEPNAGFISVLSPVGLALLGRCVGARVVWTMPSGKQRLLTIDAVLFQPESSGDYTT